VVLIEVVSVINSLLCSCNVLNVFLQNKLNSYPSNRASAWLPHLFVNSCIKCENIIACLIFALK